MNSYTKQQVKPGDVFRHLESGALYKLLRTERVLPTVWAKSKEAETVYVFIDLQTDQQVDYSWKMFRERLKYAPEAARILYEESKNEEVKG